MDNKLNSGGAGSFTGRQKSRLYDFNIQQQRLGGRELLTFLSNVSFTRKGKSPVLEALCPCARVASQGIKVGMHFDPLKNVGLFLVGALKPNKCMFVCRRDPDRRSQKLQKERSLPAAVVLIHQEGGALRCDARHARTPG